MPSSKVYDKAGRLCHAEPPCGNVHYAYTLVGEDGKDCGGGPAPEYYHFQRGHLDWIFKCRVADGNMQPFIPGGRQLSLMDMMTPRAKNA